MPRPITTRQAEVLEKVQGFILKHGYPPSTRELMSLARINSLRGATNHLDALERKGYIDRGNGRVRAITIHRNAQGQRVRLEYVATGGPSDA